MANDLNFNVGVDTSQAKKELTEFQKRIQDTAQAMTDAFDRIKGAAGALAATLIGIGAAAASYADDVKDLADAHELAVGEVLALQSALSASGGKADSAGMMLSRLGNAIEDANGGNFKLISSFQKLGVSMNDLGSASQTEIRDKLLNALAQIEDPAERNALAMQFFDKSLMGVDLKKFAQEQQESRDEMERFGPVISDAADAFENINKILKQIKLAFLSAFQPVFQIIKDLKIETDTLTKAFHLMAAALVAMSSAAVIAGLGKVYTLVKSIGAVASKNPLIALGTALLSLGAGAAAYFGLSEKTAEVQKENTERVKQAATKTTQINRDQSEVTNQLEKQKASLSAIGQALQRAFAASLDRLQSEKDALTLSEQDRKLKDEIAKIDQQSADAKANLEKAYQALSKDGQDRQKKFFQDELAAIDQRASKQKEESEARIQALYKEKSILDSIKILSDQFVDSVVTNFNNIARFRISSETYSGAIEAETKLNQLTQLRQGLLAKTNNLNQEEREAAKRAVNDATTQYNLLDMNYAEINNAIRENILLQQQQGNINSKTTETILNNLREQQAGILASAQILDNNNKIIADRSRSFEYGWAQAFKRYSENAQNAAERARSIFESVTKGIEDLIVKFARTGKFEFKNFLASIAEEILRSNIRQLLANLFGNTGIRGQSTGNFLGNLFAGFFANGGSIPGGKFGVVGERGPELVAGPATVTPMAQTTNVFYSISAVDARSFKELVASDPTFIHAVAMQGGKGLARRY